MRRSSALVIGAVRQQPAPTHPTPASDRQLARRERGWPSSGRRGPASTARHRAPIRTAPTQGSMVGSGCRERASCRHDLGAATRRSARLATSSGQVAAGQRGDLHTVGEVDPAWDDSVVRIRPHAQSLTCVQRGRAERIAVRRSKGGANAYASRNASGLLAHPPMRERLLHLSCSEFLTSSDDPEPR